MSVENRQWITISDHLGHKEFTNLDMTSHIGLVIEEQSFLKEDRKGTFMCAAELQNANPGKLLFKQEHLLNTQQLKLKNLTSVARITWGTPLKWVSRAVGGGGGAGKQRCVYFLKVILHRVGEGPL